MFSLNQKKKLAAIVERAILDLNHPEMPKEKPVFKLHVDGLESWSWADIAPNWTFDDTNKPDVNPWNERLE